MPAAVLVRAMLDVDSNSHEHEWHDRACRRRLCGVTVMRHSSLPSLPHALIHRAVPAAMPICVHDLPTYRLVDLESEDSRLNEADGLSIDADETATFLDESDGGGLCRHQLFVSSCDFHRCRLSFD